MISESNDKLCSVLYGVFVVIFLNPVYNNTKKKLGFWDIRNNQGLRKCYQPRPTLNSTFIISGIT